MDVLLRFLQFSFLIALLAVAAVAVPLQVFDNQGIERVEQLASELEQLKEENRAIRRKNEAIRRQIRAFHADPEYVEKIAREELGMVGPNEVVYQFLN